MCTAEDVVPLQKLNRHLPISPFFYLLDFNFSGFNTRLAEPTRSGGPEMNSEIFRKGSYYFSFVITCVSVGPFIVTCK